MPLECDRLYRGRIHRDGENAQASAEIHVWMKRTRPKHIRNWRALRFWFA